MNPGEQIEPLPDIDFNIRAGNTLVGLVTRDEVKHAIGSKLDFDNTLQAIEEKAELVEKAFRRFRQVQTHFGIEPAQFGEAKADLRGRLDKLRRELDGYLAGEYGIDSAAGPEFARWRASHHPFHWFVEFYGIMRGGGFDVIVGNPPFVEYRKVRSQYTIKRFVTESCANLYAFVMERSAHLIHQAGHFGLIVPIAAIRVSETGTLRELLKKQFSSLWLSNYAIRPAKLFEGVEQRLTIAIGQADNAHGHRIYSTKYNQWYVEERPYLFQKLAYCEVTTLSDGEYIPKVGDDLLLSVVRKVQESKGSVIGQYLVNESEIPLFFHRTPGYWIRIMDFQPYFKSPTHDRSIHHIRELHVGKVADLKVVGAILSSSMYFAWFFAVGNCRNLTLEDVKLFPFGTVSDVTGALAARLFDELMADYKKNSVVRYRGETEFQEFDWAVSKSIVDQIDAAIGPYYGLTREEVDYVKSYDIKIRLGRDALELDEENETPEANTPN